MAAWPRSRPQESRQTGSDKPSSARGQSPRRSLSDHSDGYVGELESDGTVREHNGGSHSAIIGRRRFPLTVACSYLLHTSVYLHDLDK